MRLCKRNKQDVMKYLKIDEAMFEKFLRLTWLGPGFIENELDKYEAAGNKFYGYTDREERRIEAAMQLIDHYLDNHGVEGIHDESWHNGGFWMQCGARYSNAGDAYKSTVLYDVKKDVFVVTSWGDWYEANEPKRGRNGNN